MTVVKRCASLEDAYMIKNLLEAGGVESDILDEATASTAPYLLVSSGIRVTVADEDAAAAREILGLPEGEEPPPPRKGSSLPWFALAIAVIAIVSLVFSSRQGGSATGQHKVERDRNGDGKSDAWITFDKQGHAVLGVYDENFDGRVDFRVEYDSKGPVKSMKDLDRDGSFDYVQTDEFGVPASALVTPGGEGFPLIRYVYRQGVLESRWEDTNRDGTWDLRIDYDAMGRETARVPMK